MAPTAARYWSPCGDSVNANRRYARLGDTWRSLMGAYGTIALQHEYWNRRGGGPQASRTNTPSSVLDGTAVFGAEGLANALEIARLSCGALAAPQHAWDVISRAGPPAPLPPTAEARCIGSSFVTAGFRLIWTGVVGS